MHPRARHTKWVHECGLDSSDEWVQDHDLAMRMLEMGLSFDQLNLSELSCFELLVRKAQMAEWRYRDRLLSTDHDDLFNDQYLYLGTGETRGLVMVSPELQEHINSELHREAAIMKERRKVGEERMLSRGGGGGSGGGKADLQKKIQQQAAELKKLQQKVGGDKGDDKGDGGGAGGGRKGGQRGQ